MSQLPHPNLDIMYSIHGIPDEPALNLIAKSVFSFQLSFSRIFIRSNLPLVDLYTSVPHYYLSLVKARG